MTFAVQFSLVVYLIPATYTRTFHPHKREQHHRLFDICSSASVVTSASLPSSVSAILIILYIILHNHVNSHPGCLYSAAKNCSKTTVRSA